jgi:multicomponent Na+:H+ antiporter subunit F
MFKSILFISLCILALTILLNLYRVIKGPTSSDRIQALDSIGINIIASIGIFSILFHTRAFFDLMLLIGILSFIGTIAFARFIERSVVIERNR